MSFPTPFSPIESVNRGVYSDTPFSVIVPGTRSDLNTRSTNRAAFSMTPALGETASKSLAELTASTVRETPTEYLERLVFPVLLPGIENLLKAVKRQEQAVAAMSDPSEESKSSQDLELDGLTWLAEFLTKNNPRKEV
ncbi:MAG: hypothetical protein SGCHY_000766 [Lobulomycetales sp.]